jgi:hypothetical protein
MVAEAVAVAVVAVHSMAETPYQCHLEALEDHLQEQQAAKEEATVLDQMLEAQQVTQAAVVAAVAVAEQFEALCQHRGQAQDKVEMQEL